MQRSTITRRQFLNTTATAAAVTPYFFSGQSSNAGPTSKNDRPHIACIGVGSRGLHDAKWAAKFGDIVAVCDVDQGHTARAKEVFEGRPDEAQDYRDVLAREDVDVVINATPDHWHTIINVAACRAGKDVYAEKPLTLTINEGKRLIRVVEETKRIVQVGTHQRSMPQFRTAVELVRNGRLGKLKQVWVALPYFSTKGGPFPKQDIPEALNWDLYQGPAPVSDYCRERTHANFRWWYEYAGGITTDWGNHHVDIAHWGMDCESTGPVSIDARGIFPNEAEPQCYNTADRFYSQMRYPTGIGLLYFSALNDRRIYGAVEQHAPTPEEDVDWLFGSDTSDEIKEFNRNGIMFIGEEGRIFVNRGGIYGKAVEQLETDPLPADAWRAPASDDHMANFFASIRSRAEPISPVRIQHRTVSACHLTNISMRLGRKLQWDAKIEKFVDDSEADGWLRREPREPYGIPA